MTIPYEFNILTQKDVIPSPFDARDFAIRAEKIVPVTYTCPIKVPIKDQGPRSTCVAHAIASLIEYHHKRQYKEYQTFSTEFIYGCRDEGMSMKDGMVIRQALQIVQNYGDCYKDDCPGNHDFKHAYRIVNEKRDHYIQLAYPHRISTYYRCKTHEEIKTALVKHGPVLVSMNTYDGAKTVNDIYTYNPEAKYGRHCVMVYGYDERGWLVQNSWGMLYGGDGRFVLPYDFKLNEAWGVTDDIYDDNIRKKGTNKLADLIYKIFNAVVSWWVNFTDRT